MAMQLLRYNLHGIENMHTVFSQCYGLILVLGVSTESKECIQGNKKLTCKITITTDHTNLH